MLWRIVVKDTSINSFWNTKAGIFFRYKVTKQSLALLNEYSRLNNVGQVYNAVAKEKSKLGNKMELLVGVLK